MWSNRYTGPGALRLDIYTEAVVSIKETLRTDDLLHEPRCSDERQYDVLF